MTETNYDVERARRLGEEEWTDPQIANGWRKWHAAYREWSHPITEEMIRVGNFEPGTQILDVSSGSGEPAITLASLVAPDGSVTATELGTEMLAVAEANAKALGVDNMVFRQADVHSLPFADDTFDIVTCRHGVMYFGNYLVALKEMRRVLKPGGRVVLTAGGTFDQPLLRDTTGVMMKHIELPAPDPDAPDPFRFAPKGVLAKALQDAGYQAIDEEALSCETIWPGSPEDLWQWMMDIAPALRPLLASVATQRREKIESEIFAALGRHADGRGLKFPLHFALAIATK